MKKKTDMTSKEEIKKSPELLAPAGGMKELKAAVSAGADAVYIGGRLFNARMNAGNFDDEEMKQAVRYAHLRGVKIYVTMNTLVFDDELGEALKYAAFLYECNVDALIIQDLGLGRIIKKNIPHIEIHLSTQGTVYNASGALSAKKLGYSRVVAAREMSLEEIKEMAKICETEVFVHGAICMCYSGQCQLSRSIGGRSGNRGQCAQPCRLLYANEKGEKGYWLSPKDLCLVDRLGELIDAGAASFKIEGRMKSPEYVEVVTSIYRKYIDMYMEKGAYTVSDEDRSSLRQIFSRGDFTEGYFSGGQPADFLSGDLPKHQGILIGHVLGKGSRDLVRVMLTGELSMGDGIEIRGGAPGERRPAGNIVTYIENGGKRKAHFGEVIIGDIRGDIRPGDFVYRISSKEQIRAARELAECDDRKIPVRMSFFAMPGKKARLKAGCSGNFSQSGKHEEVSVESEEVIEQAIARSADEEFVKSKLAKTGDSVYIPEKMDIKLAGECHIQAGTINAMRRKALGLLDEERLKSERKALDDEMLCMHDLCSMPVEEWMIREKVQPEIILPEITKGSKDEEIKEALRKGTFEECFSGKTVMVNNLGWISELKNAGAKLYGGSGLNAANRETAAALESLGVEVAEVSKELDNEPDMLMITEYDLPCRTLEDGHGRKMTVEKKCGKTIIRKQRCGPPKH